MDDISSLHTNLDVPTRCWNGQIEEVDTVCVYMCVYVLLVYISYSMFMLCVYKVCSCVCIYVSMCSQGQI